MGEVIHLYCVGAFGRKGRVEVSAHFVVGFEVHALADQRGTFEATANAVGENGFTHQARLAVGEMSPDENGF